MFNGTQSEDSIEDEITRHLVNLNSFPPECVTAHSLPYDKMGWRGAAWTLSPWARPR